MKVKAVRRVLLVVCIVIPAQFGCAARMEQPAEPGSHRVPSAPVQQTPELDAARTSSKVPGAVSAASSQQPVQPPHRSSQREPTAGLDEDAALAAVRSQPEVAEWLDHYSAAPGYRVRLVVTDRDARFFQVKVEVVGASAEAEIKAGMTLWYEVDRHTGEVTKVEL